MNNQKKLYQNYYTFSGFWSTQKIIMSKFVSVFIKSPKKYFPIPGPIPYAMRKV